MDRDWHGSEPAQGVAGGCDDLARVCRPIHSMTKSQAFWTWIAVVSVSAIAIAAEQSGVALRYVTAPYAFRAIGENLGSAATNAILSVDVKRNLIVLDPAHGEARVVGAFLSGLDQQLLQVRVDATITRISDGRGNTPPSSEVLVQRTIQAGTASPAILNVPEENSSIQVEIKLVQTGK